ncbi:MAG: hypothetical protein HY911_04795 [Desulfobacterales bacterium]|nr:hypothetical protein [Desulfobacterales bacterium]
MTLDELYRTLPNGFHDAVVHSVTVDYSKREVRFNLSLWVGDLEGQDKGARYDYRDGILALYHFGYYIVEAPDPSYPYYGTNKITIDTGELKSLRSPPAVKLPPTQEGMFVSWIYVFEWNSFIYVAARRAELQWNGKK